MFSEEIEKLSWEETTRSIYAKTEADVCRALNILATRRTSWCRPDFVGFLYSLMKDDPALTVFSIRPGQVVNVMLFKIGNPSFTAGIYRATAWLVSLFKRK